MVAVRQLGGPKSRSDGEGPGQAEVHYHHPAAQDRPDVGQAQGQAEGGPHEWTRKIRQLRAQLQVQASGPRVGAEG
jgi:hypothetical protein